MIWLANERNSYASRCGNFRVFVRPDRTALLTQYVGGKRSRWTSAHSMRAAMEMARHWPTRAQVTRYTATNGRAR